MHGGANLMYDEDLGRRGAEELFVSKSRPDP